MNIEPTWIDLAHEIEKLKAVQPLWAEWLAYVGSEDYGLWFLRPDGQESDEARATFSLTAAQIINKLKLPPVPIPKPLQYCPHWELSCKTEEEMARREGKVLDLSGEVPHGLDKVDFDAVDPCTRALLELLRRERRAFQISTTGTDWIKGIAYQTITGEIKDLCETVASFCKRRARDEIGAQLSNAPLAVPAEGENAQVLASADVSQVGRKSKPVRRNLKYLTIYEALRQIAESRPATQEEVFQSLQDRKIVIPPADPFRTARGWIPGFRVDHVAARAWLSKRWRELDLPPLPRGPKSLKNRE